MSDKLFSSLRQFSLAVLSPSIAAPTKKRETYGRYFWRNQDVLPGRSFINMPMTPSGLGDSLWLDRKIVLESP